MHLLTKPLCSGWKSSLRARQRPTWHLPIALVSVCLLAACFPESEETDTEPAPVRGLITTVVRSAEETRVRRYPGVLEPGEVNVLSFKVGGRMGKLDLNVGQRVDKEQLLAELDAAQFLTSIENRQASVDEAAAELAQDEEDLERSEGLLQRGVVTKVQRDEDATAVKTSRAQLVQAQKDLTSAEEDFADSKLYAPFDAIVNAVEAESFATVSAGESVLSIYEEGDLEVSFSVNFEVVSQLVVGTPATVRLADAPDQPLAAVVSELGERAETVSSFPVVVQLQEVTPFIKPGMAVEVSFAFEVPNAEAFLIPISAAIPEGQIPEGAGPSSVLPVPVYVFDPETSTVKRRTITFAGLRGNKLLVVEGLTEGEHVATKGVSFLREGMEVKLLEPRE